MAKKRLWPKEETFVRQYVKTGDAEYSAWKAGYGGHATAGYNLLKVPMVMDAIEARRMTRDTLDRTSPLFAEDLKLRIAGRRGEGFSYGPNDDDKPSIYPSNTDASKLHAVFWKAYYGTEGARPLSEREMSELSGDELRALMTSWKAEAERLESAIASRARTVDAIEMAVAPDPVPEPNPFD